MIKRYCKRCGKEFEASRTATCYCSQKCIEEDLVGMDEVLKNCDVCRKEINPEDKSILVTQSGGYAEQRYRIRHILCHFKELKRDIQNAENEVISDKEDIIKEELVLKQMKEEIEDIKKNYKDDLVIGIL